jgi:lysophospholipase L1-like esterase
MAVSVAAFGACAIADNVPQEGRLHIYSGDTIAMWGDSIGIPQYKYWEQLEIAVNAFYNSRGLTPPTFIDNHSGGAKTDWLTQPLIQAIAIADEPDVVILEIGINDVNGGITKEQSAVNIDAFWTVLLAEFPSLRGMMLGPWEKSPFEEDIRLYSTEHAAVARSRGFAFVNLRAYQDADPGVRTTDQVHPNDEGKAWLSGKAMFQIALHTETRP